MSDVAIAMATAAHENEALALIEELFEPPGGRPAGYSRDSAEAGFRHAVESPNADVLLAVEGGAIIGLATVYAEVVSIRYGLRCWLEEMIVTSSHRGSGVGRMLLEAASQWAREHGCTHLQLHSGLGRADAHRFYRAHGMEDVAYVFHRVVGRDA